jgi:DNA-binding NarL/FixJ family response regulator
VALIEDNRLVREGITALLNQHPDLEVVAEGSNGGTLTVGAVNPHVVLLDLGLRNGDSLRVAEHVKRDFPEAKIRVFTCFRPCVGVTRARGRAEDGA